MFMVKINIVRNVKKIKSVKNGRKLRMVKRLPHRLAFDDDLLLFDLLTRDNSSSSESHSMSESDEEFISLKRRFLCGDAVSSIISGIHSSDIHSSDEFSS